MERFADDPSLVRARHHDHWFIEDVMRGCDAGELALIVGIAICERWVLEHKASYGYELAWIFERDRGTIRNALRHLEERGEIERVDPKYMGRRIFYKPTATGETEYLRPRNNEFMDALWPQNLHESCPCNDAPAECSKQTSHRTVNM